MKSNSDNDLSHDEKNKSLIGIIQLGTSLTK